jgi:hypothetical protein
MSEGNLKVVSEDGRNLEGYKALSMNAWGQGDREVHTMTHRAWALIIVLLALLGCAIAPKRVEAPKQEPLDKPLYSLTIADRLSELSNRQYVIEQRFDGQDEVLVRGYSLGPDAPPFAAVELYTGPIVGGTLVIQPTLKPYLKESFSVYRDLWLAAKGFPTMTLQTSIYPEDRAATYRLLWRLISALKEGALTSVKNIVIYGEGHQLWAIDVAATARESTIPIVGYIAQGASFPGGAFDDWPSGISVRIYAGSTESTEAVAAMRAMDASLKARGIDSSFRQMDRGGHNFDFNDPSPENRAILESIAADISLMGAK